MADQKVEQDLPAKLQIFFHPPAWISTDFYDKSIKKPILTIFKMLYLREYFMKFSEIASPDILGVEGSHHVAKNFGNNFNPKFQQQLRKWE